MSQSEIKDAMDILDSVREKLTDNEYKILAECLMKCWRERQPQERGQIRRLFPNAIYHYIHPPI